MAAVERHRDRACGQQLFESDQVPRFVGQMKGRHRIAGPWRRHAGAVLPQPIDQTVYRRGEFGSSLSRGVGECLQLLA